MSKPHQPTAPSRFGSLERTRPIAVRMPSAAVAGSAASRCIARPNRVSGVVQRVNQPLQVPRHQRHRQEHDDHNSAEDRRDHRRGERCGTRENPEIQAEANDHERRHVNAVEQNQECHHPARDDPRAHARAPQRPSRQRDSAGAGGGEQPRGGQPGHRDLVALPPADPRLSAHEHGPEQRDVAAEREELEKPREHKPPHVALTPAGSRSPGDPGSSAARSTGTRRSRGRTARTRARAHGSIGSAGSSWLAVSSSGGEAASGRRRNREP